MYRWAGPTGCRFVDVREPSGTYFPQDTPRAVVDGLEFARTKGARVRFWLGSYNTGKSWAEEFDTAGYVGRSSGQIKVPILLAQKTSDGGGAILVRSIVKLLVGSAVVYEHPTFDMGRFKVCEIDSETHAGYTHGVEIDDKVHARFKSFKAAMRWAEFMTGKRHNY